MEDACCTANSIRFNSTIVSHHESAARNRSASTVRRTEEHSRTKQNAQPSLSRSITRKQPVRLSMAVHKESTCQTESFAAGRWAANDTDSSICSSSMADYESRAKCSPFQGNGIEPHPNSPRPEDEEERNASRIDPMNIGVYLPLCVATQ